MSPEPKDGLTEVERMKALAQAACAIESFPHDWEAWDAALASLIRERDRFKMALDAIAATTGGFAHGSWEAQLHVTAVKALETPSEPLGGG